MIKRWFDDLWGLERSMDESSPLPNLKLQKVGNSGPWLHRLLVLSTIFLTIFYQEKIVDIFESVNLTNMALIIIIQFIMIIFFWGILHKFLRLS